MDQACRLPVLASFAIRIPAEPPASNRSRGDSAIQGWPLPLEKGEEPLARAESSRVIARNERSIISLALTGTQPAPDLVVRFLNVRSAPAAMVLAEQFGFDAFDGTMEPSQTG